MREKEGYRDNIAALNEAFPGQRWLTVNDVASYLGIDKRTVKGLITKKKLPATDVGCGKNKIYRINKLELAKL